MLLDHWVDVVEVSVESGIKLASQTYILRISGREAVVDGSSLVASGST